MPYHPVFTVGYKYDKKTRPFAWFTAELDAEAFLASQDDDNLEMWEL